VNARILRGQNTWNAYQVATAAEWTIGDCLMEVYTNTDSTHNSNGSYSRNSKITFFLV